MITAPSSASTRIQFLPREPPIAHPRSWNLGLQEQLRYLFSLTLRPILIFLSASIDRKDFRTSSRSRDFVELSATQMFEPLLTLSFTLTNIDSSDEYVVFVSPTKLQLSMMTKLLHPDNLHSFASSTAKSLALIGLLSKLCNSPCLLKKNGEWPKESGMRSALELIPSKAPPEDVSLSGKLILWISSCR
jgi:hypothetical protein